MQKHLIWGACLLLTGTALAQNKTTTDQKTNSKTPAASSRLNNPASGSNAWVEYKVQAGDNDWTLAHRFSISLGALKMLNPTLDWRNLPEGSVIRLPASAVFPSPVVSAPVQSQHATVIATRSTLRSKPSKSAERLALVDKGVEAVVLTRGSEWTKLKLEGGKVGWMNNDLLKVGSVNSAAAARERIVAAAESPSEADKHEVAGVAAHSGVSVVQLMQRAYNLRGTRYRYGGLSSRSGLDCSGFTSTVFKAVGIKLPRTSRSQSAIGYAVHRGQLKPGDLVFFRTGRSSRINHVGIYAGNGKFIHAASGYGAVRVDSLDGHYSHEMAGARRVPRIVQKRNEQPVAEDSHTAEKSAPKKSLPGDQSEQIPMVAGPSAPKVVTVKSSKRG